jgi:hypothetical protein
MSAGFIKLSRKFFANHLWNEARIYSKREYNYLKILAPFAFDGYTECFTDDILKTDIIKYFK